MRDACAFILRFWFDETPPQQWFQTDPAFDQTVRDAFLPLLQQAAAGTYDEWRSRPDGTLALILLFDQFPRNMFRGTARMFEYDDRALVIARAGIAAGFDQIQPLIRRRFFYLPFEHSEDRVDQEMSVKLFASLRAEDPLGFEYAVRHQAVIERFGRFPHRNAILGRPSTDDERDFLETTPTGF